MNKHSSFYEKALKRKKQIKKLKLIEYELKEKTVDFLFDFGMAFMAKKDIKLTNRTEIKQTPHKSFENVLLVLDRKYRTSKLKAKKL